MTQHIVEILRLQCSPVVLAFSVNRVMKFRRRGRTLVYHCPYFFGTNEVYAGTVASRGRGQRSFRFTIITAFSGVKN